MRITYHGHSGFSVRTDRRLMIFDYLGQGLEKPGPADRTLAFVSHAHGDHFHPTVDAWSREGCVQLIAGFDVKADGMKPGDRMETDGAVIRAFDSTDQGVSFLVEADGARIFHAGDLNFWHWRHESSEEEIREAEEAFERAIAPLRGEEIDLAFFPVDPRMGEGYEEGALRFIQAVKPQILVPMHFWDRPEAAREFAKRPMPQGVRVQALTGPGETFDMEPAAGAVV